MAYSYNMGVREIREGLAAQEFSAREIAQANFEHIAKADEAVHAYLELTEDMAYEAADKIDAAVANGTLDSMGPLAGVPVAFKDNMNLEGTHTTCSSKMLENYEFPLYRNVRRAPASRLAAFRWAS